MSLRGVLGTGIVGALVACGAASCGRLGYDPLAFQELPEAPRDGGDLPDAPSFDGLGTPDVPLTVDVPAVFDGMFDAQVGEAGEDAGHPGSPFLRVVLGNGGRVQSTPAGIDCPGDCAELFAPGTAVTLTATLEDWHLASWTPATCAGTSCVVTVERETQVTMTMIQQPGTSVRFLGTGTPGFTDGPRREATIFHGFDVLWAPEGMYIADTDNDAIRRLEPDGNVITLVGRAGDGYRDGPPDVAQMRYPIALARDREGRLLIADERNHAIRRLELDGSLSTIAGTGVAGFRDGPALQAQFNSPRDILLEDDGSLLIVDKQNRVLRRLRDGMVSLVCGQPVATGVVTDGDCAGTARFHFPVGFTRHTDGHLYVAEWSANVIRRVSPQGVVTTWAGSPGVRGFADGVPSSTILSRPAAVMPDVARGGLWILEQEGGHRVRFFDGAVITRIFGPATSDFVQAMHVEGDDPRFRFPESFALDPQGCLTIIEGSSVVSRACPR